MSYTYTNYFGEEILRLETSDYRLNDKVTVKKNRGAGTGSKVPQYLEGDEMWVAGIGKKNIKITGNKYPGEFWYADPNEIQKLDSHD